MPRVVPESINTPIAPTKRPPLRLIGRRSDQTRTDLINQLWAWLESQRHMSGQIILIDAVKIVVAKTEMDGPLVMVYMSISDKPLATLYAKSGVQRCQLLTTSILQKLVQQL